jgi:hypothetical protein
MRKQRRHDELRIELGFFKANAVGIPAILVLGVIVLAGFVTKVFGLW